MIDNFERDQAETDREAAYLQAVDLITGTAYPTAGRILEILDADFRGSCFFPSADSRFVADVDRMIREKP